MLFNYPPTPLFSGHVTVHIKFCIKRLSSSCVILITEDGAIDKKAKAEQMPEVTFGKVVEIQKLITSLYDLVRVAQDVAEVIEKEHD